MYQQFRPSSILPPVVKNLLIINGLMYFATVALSEKFNIDLTNYLALYYPGSEHFRLYQLVTHLFMHGSLMHLFSNMFALWMFGNLLENVWGSRKFFIYYFITGFGAAIVHLGFTWFEVEKMRMAVESYAANANPGDFSALVHQYGFYFEGDKLTEYLRQFSDNASNVQLKQETVSFMQQLYESKVNVPTVGASGAVFGVLLAFGMLFPNTLLYVFFAIPVKAKYVVTLYGLFELYNGFQVNPADNVAHFAHLGGMLFGFILVKFWGKKDRQNFY